jgi:UDP-N-acetylmuramyl pentapeptide phosphotransferase/UDP-N-acetylglucosamine-1-phosphate transferase
MFQIIVFIFSLFLAWFILLVITPKFINLARERGWTGKDMNKFDKREVSELGGVPVFFGFLLSILLDL